jgi:hypothetical protein
MTIRFAGSGRHNLRARLANRRREAAEKKVQDTFSQELPASTARPGRIPACAVLQFWDSYPLDFFGTQVFGTVSIGVEVRQQS